MPSKGAWERSEVRRLGLMREARLGMEYKRRYGYPTEPIFQQSGAPIIANAVSRRNNHLGNIKTQSQLTPSRTL